MNNITAFDLESTKNIRKKTNELKSYYLMNKDTKVCMFDRKTGEANILQENLMPLDLYLEYGTDADVFNNRQVFDWWCAKRILSLDREYAKIILNSCGLKQAVTDSERATIALQYKCLSLRDFFWVKNVQDKSSWDDVNLFKNHLSNAIVDIALNGKPLTLTNTQLITTDLSTDGIMPKAWYRKGNTFILYKGNKDNSVEKEVRASQILRELGLNVLKYCLTEYNGTKVSACECFTSEDIGYITAGDLNSNWELNIDCREYFEMLLADYLIGNSDRHQDNWGYLFDSQCKIIAFAPIFDFNHAFEAPTDYTCLPEMLLGRKKTLIESAKESIKKLEYTLQKIPEIDDYTGFVNERIQLLNSLNN